jgi:hypothetical protein
MSEKITTVAAEVEKMKAWCLDNYENGADTMVECWGDEDYANLFVTDTAFRTVAEAWETLKAVASVYRERQADASYYEENN